MSSSDVLPDREDLRRVGELRARRARHAVWAATAVLLILIPVSSQLFKSGMHSLGRGFVIGLILAGVILAVGVPIMLWLRRLSWPATALSAGGNRATRQAVRRAIRIGRAPNARINELARQEAQQIISGRALIRIWTAALIVQVTLFAAQVFQGGPARFLVLYGLSDLFQASGLGLLLYGRYRSRRYLLDQPRQGRQ